MERHQFIVVVAIAALVSAGVSSATTAVIINTQNKSSLLAALSTTPTTTASEVATVDTPVSAPPVTIEDREDRIANIVQKYSPSVVSVIAKKEVPTYAQCQTQVDPNDFFGRIFPEFFNPQLCQNGTEERQVSAGTGFVVSSGLIATNKHVVSDTGAKYYINTSDGKTLSGTVLARDPFQDLAIIKVENLKLDPIPLGDSDNLQIGTSVIAIGNALGEFQNSVSVGIISGLSRTITASSQGESEQLRSVIQTDAAINPGNSGGPLIDIHGNVIGINTAVATGAENVGFALPINLLKRDLDSVKRTGRIIYPYLGVRYTELTPEIAKSRGLAVTEGALVLGTVQDPGVVPNSPAAAAGLREGDIIRVFNGVSVSQKNRLTDLIQARAPGDRVSMRVQRGAETITLSAVLAEYKQ